MRYGIFNFDNKSLFNINQDEMDNELYNELYDTLIQLNRLGMYIIYNRINMELA